jgi:hypothetical protein
MTTAMEFEMKSNRKPLRGRNGPFALLAVLLSAAALVTVLGGCGGLNDNPNPGGLAVAVEFPKADGAQTAGVATQALTFTGEGEQVLTVVVGAIVINHDKAGDGVIRPYNNTDILNLTERQRDLLEADAKQSVIHLEVVPLPWPLDYVEFDIPPDNAGPWQLFAVGLRNQVFTVSDITSESPIWYGFIDKFLNNQAAPGQFVGTVLMEAVCSASLPDNNPGSPPCPAP